MQTAHNVRWIVSNLTQPLIFFEGKNLSIVN